MAKGNPTLEMLQDAEIEWAGIMDPRLTPLVGEAPDFATGSLLTQEWEWQSSSEIQKEALVELERLYNPGRVALSGECIQAMHRGAAQIIFKDANDWLKCLGDLEPRANMGYNPASKLSRWSTLGIAADFTLATFALQRQRSPRMVVHIGPMDNGPASRARELLRDSGL